MRCLLGQTQPTPSPTESRSASHLESRETHTRRLGDAWLDGGGALILVVPSVIMPIASAPDRNVLINHRHVAIAGITVTAITPFIFDPRPFQTQCSGDRLGCPVSRLAQSGNHQLTSRTIPKRVGTKLETASGPIIEVEMRVGLSDCDCSYMRVPAE
jgi:hypothetical protein